MAVPSRANSDYGRYVDEVKEMSLFPLRERTGGLKPGSSCVPAHPTPEQGNRLMALDIKIPK